MWGTDICPDIYALSYCPNWGSDTDFAESYNFCIICVEIDSLTETPPVPFYSIVKFVIIIIHL